MEGMLRAFDRGASNCRMLGPGCVGSRCGPSSPAAEPLPPGRKSTTASSLRRLSPPVLGATGGGLTGPGSPCCGTGVLAGASVAGGFRRGNQRRDRHAQRRGIRRPATILGPRRRRMATRATRPPRPGPTLQPGTHVRARSSVRLSSSRTSGRKQGHKKRDVHKTHDPAHHHDDHRLDDHAQLPDLALQLSLRRTVPPRPAPRPTFPPFPPRPPSARAWA